MNKKLKTLLVLLIVWAIAFAVFYFVGKKVNDDRKKNRKKHLSNKTILIVTLIASFIVGLGGSSLA